MVQNLPSRHKALGSILSTTKERKKTKGKKIKRTNLKKVTKATRMTREEWVPMAP